MTVPARPQSTSTPPVSAAGVTSQSSPEVSMRVPSETRAPAISSVSRERRARRTTLGPSARAARTSARLVSDLLPGRDTSARTGPCAKGARHGPVVTGAA